MITKNILLDALWKGLQMLYNPTSLASVYPYSIQRGMRVLLLWQSWGQNDGRKEREKTARGNEGGSELALSCLKATPWLCPIRVTRLISATHVFIFGGVEKAWPWESGEGNAPGTVKPILKQPFLSPLHYSYVPRKSRSQLPNRSGRYPQSDTFVCTSDDLSVVC